jgi:rhamnosyl/mannosyltransferase
LGLQGKVHFLGQVSDQELPVHYHASDLFVLPASERSEAFGTVLVEAMASGLPVISTELGTGTSAVNVHGETGLVVEARNREALRHAIQVLLDNRSLRHSMGQEARRRALSQYSVRQMVERTEAIYAELLDT